MGRGNFISEKGQKLRFTVMRTGDENNYGRE
jgi:hypothetical protein